MFILRFIIYLAICLCMIHGALVVRPDTLLVLTAAMIVIPVISFLLCVIQSLLITGSIQINTDAIEIKFRKKGILPIIKTGGVLCISYDQSGEKYTEKIVTSIPAGESVLRYEIKKSYLGTGQLYLEKMRIQDIFGFFCLPAWHLNKKKQGFAFYHKITALPVKTPPSGDTDEIIENMFDLTHPGDDVSQVFQIREYLPGDKLSGIHWKLSAKENKLMVKDFSLPYSSAVNLLPDFCEGLSQQKFTTVLKNLLNVSSALLNLGAPHRISLILDGNEEAFLIKDDEDLEMLERRIFDTKKFTMKQAEYIELTERPGNHGFKILDEPEIQLLRRWDYEKY